MSAAHGGNFDKVRGATNFDMECPVCHKGTCVVANLSRKYEPILRKVQEEMLLPKIELDILQTLFNEDTVPRRPAFVAAELSIVHINSSGSGQFI